MSDLGVSVLIELHQISEAPASAVICRTSDRAELTVHDVLHVVRQHGGIAVSETSNLGLVMYLYEVSRIVARKMCERAGVIPEAVTVPEKIYAD